MMNLYISYIQSWQTVTLLVGIAVLVVALGKGADLLVDEAVKLSYHWHVPPILIGATIVSLGTTLPEAAVSVMAAFKGEPDIALGNAVGSVICDTGLILGVATLLSPLPLKKNMVHRHGWLQFGAGCLLILACIPIFSFRDTFTKGGVLPQTTGVFFLLLLIVYLWVSLKWSQKDSQESFEQTEPLEKSALGIACLVKLTVGIALVVGSSHFLIPLVRVTAVRLSIPQGIVSATLVAFGTSLPELVTAVTAVLKQHGDLAVGNVIGADILNVFFVAGASASVTTTGLSAPPLFFKVLFPAMFFLLMVFQVAVVFSNGQLKRSFGVVMLATYLVATYMSYRI